MYSRFEKLMPKKKIMLIAESSIANSGYSTMTSELLSRLHKTGKYEIAELGIHARPEDDRLNYFPWKIYPVMPAAGDKEGWAQFNNPMRLGQHGEWCFERVLLDFKPDVVMCYDDPYRCVKSCDIITYDNCKDIKDINLGDLVLTHNGRYRKVTKLFNRNYTGNIYKIKCSNFNSPIEITDKHPILIKTHKKIGIKDKLLQKEEWVNSELVKKGDLVLFPIDKGINNDISLDKARLFGYFAAEGCFLYRKAASLGNRYGVQFCFNKKEKKYIKDVINIVKKEYGLICKKRIEGNRFKIRFFSKDATNDIFNHVEGIAKNKFIKPALYHSNNEIIKHFLCGLFRGDASFVSRKASYCTASKSLAYQVFRLCLRFNILPAVSHFINNKSNTFDSESMERQRRVEGGYKKKVFYRYDISFNGKNRINAEKILNLEDDFISNQRIDGKYAYLTVKSIEITEETTKVYNFEVEEDNSYVSSFVMHNCTFQVTNPLRPYYSHLYMPTVDAYPQTDDWANQYTMSDGILSYSEFGKRVLKKTCGNSINYMGVASPGASFSDMGILDKKEIRHKYGLPEDIVILGMVARNQIRKGFPDLFETFRKFLDKAPKELGDKAFLHVHTGYPDAGWDFPRLLKEDGLSHKVYFTYVCRSCGDIRVSLWNDYGLPCRRCGAKAVFLTNPSFGLTRKKLCELYNLYDLYIQYAFCLPAGEKILLNRGWTSIEEVKLGDFAWTHKRRWKKVINLFQNKSSDIYEIKVCSDYEKLKITGNHPILALTKEKICPDYNRSLKELIGTKIKIGSFIPEPEFINTEKLRKGDLIAYPINDEIEEIETIDLANYIKETDIIKKETIKLKYGHEYNRFIKIDEEFCEFLGLYVADGSTSPEGSISVTSHANESYNIELSKKVILKLIGKVNESIYKNRKGVTVYGCSRIHYDMMLDICKKHEFKKLPDFTDRLPISLQKKIIKGLFIGDGHYKKDLKTSIYVTISPKLAEQIKNILRRLRISYNCLIVKKSGKRKPQYRFEVFGNLKNEEFSPTKHNTRNFYLDNYHYLQIKSISKIDNQNALVYNFEVEKDNSYTTKIGSVHNCEGFGVPVVEAAACGIPLAVVPYSAMEDFVEKLNAHPIPIAKMNTEVQSHREWAFPNNNLFAEQLIEILGRDLKVWGKETHELCKKHYDWDNSAKIWENAIDNLPPAKRKWSDPQREFNELPVDNTLDDFSFVKQCFKNIAFSEHLASGFLYNIFIRNLYNGNIPNSVQNGLQQSFTRENVINECKAMQAAVMHWEGLRCQSCT